MAAHHIPEGTCIDRIIMLSDKLNKIIRKHLHDDKIIEIAEDLGNGRIMWESRFLTVTKIAEKDMTLEYSLQILDRVADKLIEAFYELEINDVEPYESSIPIKINIKK